MNAPALLIPSVPQASASPGFCFTKVPATWLSHQMSLGPIQTQYVFDSSLSFARFLTTLSDLMTI